MSSKERYAGSHKTSMLGYQKSVCCEHLSSAGYVCQEVYTSLVKSFLNSWKLVPLCELIPSEQVSVSLQWALMRCVVIQSASIPSISVAEIVSHIQKWLEKLSVGSLIYFWNSYAQDLHFFPHLTEKFQCHIFRSYLQCAQSDSTSNNLLHIFSFDLYWLPSSPCLWFYFFKSNPTVYVSLNALSEKMLTAKELLMTYRDLERDQLLADLLACVSSCTDFFFGWHFSDF